MVIGFGGGIVTDVGGFLAAIFMRGVACFAGAHNTAGASGRRHGREDRRVNLVNGKNLMGSFHQPRGGADRSGCACHFTAA
jgi:3-dehydroquinate synthase